MSERYPGYDVLAKRNTPSWNQATREVIDERLAIPGEPRFFTAKEWAAVSAIAARILPQPGDRPAIPVAALVDKKLHDDVRDGHRRADLPPQRDAWRRGLAALDAEASGAHGKAFAELAPFDQDRLLRAMQEGGLDDPAWGGMPPQHFFTERLLADITHAYYSHPTAWNELGFGGPASPRGYVRMGRNKRDPWEAAEAHLGREADAAARNRRVGQR